MLAPILERSVSELKQVVDHLTLNISNDQPLIQETMHPYTNDTSTEGIVKLTGLSSNNFFHSTLLTNNKIYYYHIIYYNLSADLIPFVFFLVIINDILYWSIF